MRKQQIFSVEGLIGKTISYADDSNDELFVGFEDGDYCLFVASNWSEYNYTKLEEEEYPGEYFNKEDKCFELFERGFITETELNQIRFDIAERENKKKKVDAEANIKREISLLKSLKEKYPNV